MSFKIDFNSFIKKGIKPYENDFSIRLITGYQGSGKTWYAIYLMEKYKNRKIITNINSYKSTKNIVEYFKTIDDLYSNHEMSCIFLIDELSKRFTKDSKQDLEFYSWLQQCRKHKRQVFLITQEYIQVPQWLRGIATQVYTTKKVFRNVYKTSLGVPILNKDTFEWDIETKHSIIYKRTKDISNKYDTFEQINSL